MACPVCDGTMQNLGGRYFWCHRCGTVKSNEFDLEPPAWIRQIMHVPQPLHGVCQQTIRTVHFEVVSENDVSTIKLLKIDN